MSWIDHNSMLWINNECNTFWFWSQYSTPLQSAYLHATNILWSLRLSSLGHKTARLSMWNMSVQLPCSLQTKHACNMWSQCEKACANIGPVKNKCQPTYQGFLFQMAFGQTLGVRGRVRFIFSEFCVLLPFYLRHCF